MIFPTSFPGGKSQSSEHGVVADSPSARRRQLALLPNPSSTATSSDAGPLLLIASSNAERPEIVFDAAGIELLLLRGKSRQDREHHSLAQ